ncbi:Spo0B C-terminal domain-containing protein [Bacillus sp. SD088]|uniref:Spo0B C-terminal domain-containing protein n=1 Tax=Bacillus sp. SD088 TaxID=2782012 RepID=UPI001A95F722|nr:Spo0B C-terminal domain-containing protein [Bacillus sp. SD088]MBO0994074.1 Spo0B domain-containing protein [Bacillus sp. SD088]
MMKDKEETLTLLQHARHDWLNRIQLIKGYLALGKTEEAERVIEEIVLESQQETKLTKLGLPEFATLFLLHNWGWEGHTFQIEYEFINDLPAQFINDVTLTDWMKSFFQVISDALHPLYANQLYVSIEPLEKSLSLHFDFEGKLKDLRSLEKWLLHYEDKQIHINLKEVSETNFICNVIFSGME